MIDSKSHLYYINYQMSSSQHSQAKNPLPTTISDLLNKIEGGGNYQRNMLFLFFGCWLVSGCIMMGSPFFFRNSTFDCEKEGLLTDDCESYVCSLPRQQWETYTNKQQDFTSLITEYGPYVCDDQVYLDLAQSSVYVGSALGLIVFSFFSDNYGRKFSLLVTWTVGVIGALMLVLAQNIAMGIIGMFLLGAGPSSTLNMCFYFIGQVVCEKSRPKYSVIIQPFFAGGGLTITLFFYLITNWRIIALAILLIFSVVLWFFFFFYIEETPLFLFRKGVKPTIKALNRIGKINTGIRQILTQEEVENVMMENMETKDFQKIVTLIDLFRFSSLRAITVCMMFIDYAVVTLYYGPALSIQSIGFNIFVSSVVVQCSELIVYLPMYYFISKIKRRNAGMLLFGVNGICSLILLFLEKPDDCDFCTQSIIELVIIFIFRLSIASFYIILYIYLVELYPARTRAIGSGFIVAVGTCGSSICPLILGALSRNGINYYTFFLLMVIFGLGSLPFLPQTLGKPLKDEIEQILVQKNKVKSKLIEDSKIK